MKTIERRIAGVMILLNRTVMPCPMPVSRCTDRMWVYRVSAVICAENIPDISSPKRRAVWAGLLLNICREGYGSERKHVRPTKMRGSDWERWSMMAGEYGDARPLMGPGGESIQGDTEIEAITAALEYLLQRDGLSETAAEGTNDDAPPIVDHKLGTPWPDDSDGGEQ